MATIPEWNLKSFLGQHPEVGYMLLIALSPRVRRAGSRHLRPRAGVCGWVDRRTPVRVCCASNMRSLQTQVRLRRLLRVYTDYSERLAESPADSSLAAAASNRLFELASSLHLAWASDSATVSLPALEAPCDPDPGLGRPGRRGLRAYGHRSAPARRRAPRIRLAAAADASRHGGRGRSPASRLAGRRRARQDRLGAPTELTDLTNRGGCAP